VSVVVQLFVVKNGAVEGTELVDGDRFIVGSDPTCAVVLDDPSIAARHLGVFVHEGRLAIQDLGAPGGTRVGTEAVVGARYVGPRDDVFVGVYTLKLKLMPTAAAIAAPAPPSASPAGQAPVVPSARGGVQTSSAPSVDAAVATVAPPSSNAPPTDAGPPSGDDPAEGTPAGASTAVPAVAASAGSVPAGDAPAVAASRVPGLADLEPTLPGETTASDASPSGDASIRGVLDDVTLPDSMLPARSSDGRRDTGSSSPAARPASAPSLPPLAAATTTGVHSAPFDQGDASGSFGADDVDDEDDEDADHDAPSWSLVARLAQADVEAGPTVTVLHTRGEHVLDFRVVRAGEDFAIGDGWSIEELRACGLTRPHRLLRVDAKGQATVLVAEGVEARLLRDGRTVPCAVGEQLLRGGDVGKVRLHDDQLLLRSAGIPPLPRSADDVAADRAQRRLAGVSLGGALAFFGLFVLLGWLYGYRSRSEDVINLEDDGFAEVVQKDLVFAEPPRPPEPVPEPVPPSPPPPRETPPPPAPPATAKTESKPKPTPKSAPQAPTPATAPAPSPPATPTPGLAAALDQIPRVNDSASNQNLTAALSNIKGVRVPGATGGFKTSALTGKAASSGVQFGGAAGGLATTGINSLLRRDGGAGQLGGKGDRQVAGRVTTLARQSQVKGQGELTKDEIQRVISQHVGEIQYCYEKQLRTHAALAGRVVLEWTVTTTGSVGVVKVATSSLASTDATRCMMEKVKTWKFPRPRGNGAVTVVYPFVFNTL
jgi:TonB family protein